MLLEQALKEKLMDYRIRDRLIQEGKITEEEVAQFLQSMEDSASDVEEKELS